MKHLESFNSIKSDVEDILNIARDEGFFVSLAIDEYSKFTNCIVIGADENLIGVPMKWVNGNLPSTPWATNKKGRGPSWANSIETHREKEFYEICKNIYDRLKVITDTSTFLISLLEDSEDGYFRHDNLNQFKPNGNYYRLYFGRVSINI